MVHEALGNLLRGQGEKFSSKPDLGHESPLPHGLLEQGGDPLFPHMPLENFPSPSSFPSREQERAGEAPLIHHRGTSRFNDVKAKRDNLPVGKRIHPVRQTPQGPGLGLGCHSEPLNHGRASRSRSCSNSTARHRARREPRRVEFNGLCYAGGQERGA